jgi:probable HAF family extracellular repeat protein
MSARHRFAVVALAAAAAGVLPPAAPAGAGPAPVRVSHPTAPDGTPVEFPRAINERGEILGLVSTGDGLTYTTAVWRRGQVSVVGDPDVPLTMPFDARALSDRGHVAGFHLLSFEQTRPFSWRAGQLTYPPIDHPSGGVQDVNDHGDAIGVVGDDAFGGTQVVGWVDGALVTPPPGVRLSPSFAFPRVLNNRNEAAVDLIVDGLHQAAVWDLDTNEVTPLGTLGGLGSSVAAINEAGDVTGTSDTVSEAGHAFLWRRGTMTDLGTLGGTSSMPVAINDRGHVTGTSTVAGSGPAQAFLWRDGRMEELPSLGGTAGWPVSSPADINNRGQVVGNSTTPDGASHAVLWQDGEVVDLSAALDPVQPAFVVDVNDRGQVLGWVRGSPLGVSVVWAT